MTIRRTAWSGGAPMALAGLCLAGGLASAGEATTPVSTGALRRLRPSVMAVAHRALALAGSSRTRRRK